MFILNGIIMRKLSVKMYKMLLALIYEDLTVTIIRQLIAIA